ncbi:MAG: rhodanese-like domain-containing protein [Planctomycetota bacterium]
MRAAVEIVCASVVLALVSVSALQGGQAKDAEGATHGDDAAKYQLVNTYEYPGFRVVQFTLPVLSHYSYILVSGSDALLVDPGRDVATYLAYLEEHKLAARGVFMTHLHADFVAGHIEAAKALDVPIYKSAIGGAEYEHKPVREGDTLTVGQARLRFVETPGHTPDSTCAYVIGTQDSEQPAVIFTGDTLFVGSIGRPDLLEGKMSAAELAGMAYDTWFNKLSKAGDDAVIFPAHGAGSLCGAHLGDQPYSTIGAEKKSNPYVQHKGRAQFIAAVLEGLPEAPQYFGHNAALNRKGPELVDWDAAPPEVEPSADLTDAAKHYVVDVRPAVEYTGGHIPNSVNIALRGRLETWVGTMVPWRADLVLVGSPEELKEAARRLPRVGYKAGGLAWARWREAGLPIAKVGTLDPPELHKQMRAGTAPLIVDVRLPQEWSEVRVGPSVNFPLQHLDENTGKLDPNVPVLAVCNSAYRSSLALGLLERRGFKQVSSLVGGTDAWVEAGLPTSGTNAAASPLPTVAADARLETGGAGDSDVALRLPERIAATTLKALVKDLPGTYELIDIRPAEQFADYHVPGARNVPIAEALASAALISGQTPLILVDRDGSLAMAVAGILAQKSARPIKVLQGGAEAYWEADELAPAVRAVPLGGVGVQAGRSGGAAGPGAPAQPPPKAAQPAPAKPATPAPQPQAPRKKSVGC